MPHMYSLYEHIQFKNNVTENKKRFKWTKSVMKVEGSTVLLTGI